MPVTPKQSGRVAPLNQPRMFSRSSSSGGLGGGGSLPWHSFPLRGSLLRSPPGRSHHLVHSFASTSGGKGGVSPPLGPSDAYPTSSPCGLFERLHSSRRGLGTRGEEEAPPMLDLDGVANEAEATAQTMPRGELENAVKELDMENLMLKSVVLRGREELIKLQDGMRETYETAEKEGENIANHLTRRLNAVQHKKAQLEARLHREEAMKAEQEQKLLDLKLSSFNLSKRVQHEEEETLAALTHRLQQLQTQRQDFESLLSEQSSSLQQLQELVEGLQTQTGSGHVPLKPPEGAVEAGGDTTPSNAEDMTSAEQLSLQTGTLEHADPASDPQEMLQVLKQEVAFVEKLQHDAFERGERYRLKQKELEERISHAEHQRRSGHLSLEGIHHELAESTAVAWELGSTAKIAREVQTGRQIHARSPTGSITSGSHGFETPMGVAESPGDLTTGSGNPRSSPASPLR
ncbi:hypothetical protein TraAM80_03050 [Trypanosoma rangeli]|uniref:Uncharacterized protein n=1 Tax=Trypanosoma rangeli TaxID=5698 RepID=A0A3R7MLU6_TRYRA|nr:uncharacterized protein TraAM80_03050 [Trypanosoma rangeli]RNF08194.1 hypothetical protein TraAM80_03050 [Trypanosoma rangeli]|eukprot:RNF08194.1 hypothetical protein TraAM80_03050 [Trypanosoma rangeli]